MSARQIAKLAHGFGDGAVRFGEGSVEGIEFFVLFAGDEIWAVEEIFTLVGHGLDGLRDGGVAGDFRSGGDAAEDGGAQGDGLVAGGERDAFVEDVGVNLHEKW